MIECLSIQSSVMHDCFNSMCSQYLFPVPLTDSVACPLLLSLFLSSGPMEFLCVYSLLVFLSQLTLSSSLSFNLLFLCLCRREKNFHIFYCLMAGLGARRQLARFKLKGVNHHRYLEQRGTGKGSAKRNAIFAERFEQIENIFRLFGFTEEVVGWTFFFFFSALL